MSFDVFFSYARKDPTDIVAEVFDRLTENGISVWWDVKEMTQREPTFTEEIGLIIKKVKRLVLFIGPGMAESEYVDAEWRYARACGVKVYPLIIRHSENGGRTLDLVPQRLRKMHIRDLTDPGSRNVELEKLIRDLTEELRPLAPLLNVPALPNGYVERNVYLDTLVDRFFGQGSDSIEEKRFSAVTGMGGSGKSVIASALCHDEEIRRQFREIIWIKLGDGCGLRDIWPQLAIQCSLPKDLCELEMRIELSKKYESETCLFVLDNCNEPQLLEFFRNALDMSRNRVLVTTRDSVICNSYGIMNVRVEDLTLQEARRMISKSCGMSEEELGDSADELIRAVGGHPFAIAVGAALYMELPDWSTVVQSYYEAESILSLSMPNYEYRNVFASLEASVKNLSPETAELYCMLSVFRKEAQIPLDKIALLWSSGALSGKQKTAALARTGLILKKLASKSLLSFDQIGRNVTLHNLAYDYMLHRQDNTRYQSEFADRLGAEKDQYYYGNILYHLLGAGREEEARMLLFSVDYQVKKAEVCGIYELVRDCGQWEDDGQVEQLEMFFKLSAHVLKEDMRQYASQLFGRFSYPNDSARISELMKNALEYNRRPFLCPGEVCMIPIGQGTEDIVTFAGVPFSLRSCGGKLIVADKSGFSTVLDPDTCETEKSVSSRGWCIDAFLYGKYLVSIYGKKHLSFFDTEAETCFETETDSLITSCVISGDRLLVGDALGSVTVFRGSTVCGSLRLPTGVSLLYADGDRVSAYGMNGDVFSLTDTVEKTGTAGERIVKKQGAVELTVKGKLLVNGRPVGETATISDFDRNVYINDRSELVVFSERDGSVIRRIRMPVDSTRLCYCGDCLFAGGGEQNVYKLDVSRLSSGSDTSRVWINSLCAYDGGLYCVCQDGRISKNDELIADMKHWYNVLAVNGDYLILADNVGSISFLDRQTASPAFTLENGSRITGMVLGDGLLYVADGLGCITVWDVNGRCVRASYKNGSWITSLTRVGDMLVCSDRYGHLFKYDIGSMTLLGALDLNDKILCVTGFGGYIAAATGSGRVLLLEPSTGDELCSYYPSISAVTALYGMDGELLVCTETNMHRLRLIE